MTKKTEPTFAEMQKTLWDNVKDLKEKRDEAFAKHNKWRAGGQGSMTDLAWETSKGCSEAAHFADLIRQTIEVGKSLGLVDKSVNYLDHI